jgi:hypothetical protein
MDPEDLREGSEPQTSLGGKLRCMVAHKDSPALTGWVVIPLPGHLFGHDRLSDGRPELEQFTVDAGAPDSGSSRLMRWIRVRSSASIGGRPPIEEPFRALQVWLLTVSRRFAKTKRSVEALK